MPLKNLVQVVAAFLISLVMGFVTRDTLQGDTCSRPALDDVLNGGHLVLADSCVLIVSPAAVITGDVIIEGGMLHSNGVDRILIIEENASLTLKNVAVLSGAIQIDPAYGGGIYNAGTLLLQDSRVVANSAEQGGGIYNIGQLYVRNSEIARNRAREGGGIYNLGMMVIENSIIADNVALSVGDYGGYGAGIVNKGGAGIAQTLIINNRGDGDGIGIDTSGTLVIRQSVVMGNRCTHDDCRGSGLFRFEGTVDARHNYWGSDDGPSDDGNGDGDGIVGVPRQNYQPFLTELPAWAQGILTLSR